MKKGAMYVIAQKIRKNYTNNYPENKAVFTVHLPDSDGLSDEELLMIQFGLMEIDREVFLLEEEIKSKRSTINAKEDPVGYSQLFLPSINMSKGEV